MAFVVLKAGAVRGLAKLPETAQDGRQKRLAESDLSQSGFRRYPVK
jgi:hypothetical protein